MINYLLSSKDKTIIYEDNNKIIIDKKILYVINDLCKKRLFTYQGYIEAVKERFNIYSLIPLYIDKSLALIPILNDNNEKIWFNKPAIEKITSKDNLSLITFLNGETLISSKSINYFEKQFILLEKIKKIKQDIL